MIRLRLMLSAVYLDELRSSFDNGIFIMENLKSKFLDDDDIGLFKSFEIAITIFKVKKLIIKFLANPQSHKEIFPKLLAKYDELLTEFYDISSNQVKNGTCEEGVYLELCSETLKDRECIRQLCFYGENN